MTRTLLQQLILLGLTASSGHAGNAPPRVNELPESPPLDMRAVVANNESLVILGLGSNTRQEIELTRGVLVGPRWSPDGRHIAVLALDCGFSACTASLLLVDVADTTARVLGVFASKPPRSDFTSYDCRETRTIPPVWDPLGEHVLAATPEGVRMFDIGGSDSLVVSQVNLTALAVSADSRIAYSDGDSLWVANLQTHYVLALTTTIRGQAGLDGKISRLAWSPRGNRLAVGLGHHAVLMSMGADGRVVDESLLFKAHGIVDWMAWSEDETLIFLADANPPLESSLRNVAMPTGRTGGRLTVLAVEPSSGKSDRIYQGSVFNEVSVPAVTPDGRWLALAREFSRDWALVHCPTKKAAFLTASDPCTREGIDLWARSSFTPAEPDTGEALNQPEASDSH